MLTKFWEGVGGGIADRWADVGLPAILFWALGLLATLESGASDGLGSAGRDLRAQDPVVQAVLVFAALSAVLGTGLVVERLVTPALRLMEGYWPGALEPIGRYLVRRVGRRAEEDAATFQLLARDIDAGTATREQKRKYAEVDRRLRRLPVGDRLPTSVGNVLRAGEEMPRVKYGLSPVAVWPRLWMLLPEAARSELVTARRSLDVAVGTCVWGVMFLGFAPWAGWWVVPGPVVAMLSHRYWVRARAEVFADLFEATFDLYRPALYQRLRWPLPDTPADERASGEAVTDFLWRGSDAPTPRFTELTDRES